MFNKKHTNLDVRSAMKMVMIFLSVMVLTTSVWAANIPGQQDIMVLESGKTLDGPGFYSGRIVRIDGTVQGTTFAAGQDVTVNGTINGDLFVAGQSVSVTGRVTGNIYGAGQNIWIQSQNTGDVFAAGQSIKIDKTAMIGRDLFASGASILQEGNVPRDFYSAGSDVSINGVIGRDARLYGENIAIQDQAVINGSLDYHSERQASIAAGSTIIGQTKWTPVEPSPERPAWTPLGIMMGILWQIASALLVWVVIRIWQPDFWRRTAAVIANEPVKTLGIGAIALIVTPMLIILMMITIIGIPLGVLLAVMYGVSLYLSKIIAAVFLGSLLAGRFGWPEKHRGVWLVLLGLVIITVLSKIPMLGFLLWLVIVFAGLGAILVSTSAREKAVPEQHHAGPVYE